MELLRATMHLLLRAFGSRPISHRTSGFDFAANLDKHFALWSRGRQADLKIAQSYMLDSALFYFRTLSGKMGGDLKRIIKRYDDWRYTQHELQGIERDAGGWRDSEALIRDELRKFIVNNPQFAEQSLELVRAKMRQLGYETDSVLFELLQNADDAASELCCAAKLNAVENPDSATAQVRLAFHSQDGQSGQWSWKHNGRGINQFRVGDLNGESGRAAGYHRDLEKMLVLQASDKDDNPQANLTTGKFGLGFKSVFLVSERPQIVSGDLAFEIIGGFYPRELGDTQRAKFPTPSETPMGVSPTWLRFASEQRPEELAARFARFAPLCLLFTRVIRRLEFDFNGKVACLETKEARPFEGLGIAELGSLRLLPSQKEPLPQRVFLIRTARATLALGLDENGVCALPRDVPALWVMAPTRVETFVGWALNADWNIDVGRAQVANGDANGYLAQAIGAELGQVLARLWRQSQNLEGWNQKLGINAPTRGEFWRGLGAVVGCQNAQTAPILRAVLTQMRAHLPVEMHAFFQPLSIVQTFAETLPRSESVVVVGDTARHQEGDEVAVSPLQHENNGIAYLEEIALWWKKEGQAAWHQKPRFFAQPDLVYPLLRSDDATKRRAAWLRLLVRASVEGLGQRNWDQHRAFLEFCETKGWIAEFSRPGADVQKLGARLELYLRDDQNGKREWLLWMRRALPVFGLCAYLDDYISVFRALDRRAKCNDLSFLDPMRDSGFGAQSDAPQPPAIDDIIGIGAHFLLREMARTQNNTGLFSHSRAYGLCFYPGERMRRVLSALEPKIATQSGVAASRTAWDLLQKHRSDDPTFGGDFDLPLLLWAQKNGI